MPGGSLSPLLGALRQAREIPHSLCRLLPCGQVLFIQLAGVGGFLGNGQNSAAVMRGI